MIDRYNKKFEYLMDKQLNKCSACNKTFINSEKIDIAHNFSRTEKNIKNYPLFIDSLLNITLQHNYCNVNRRLPIYTKRFKNKRQINYYQADKYQMFLGKHKILSDIVNMC